MLKTKGELTCTVICFTCSLTVFSSEATRKQVSKDRPAPFSSTIGFSARHQSLFLASKQRLPQVTTCKWQKQQSAEFSRGARRAGFWRGFSFVWIFISRGIFVCLVFKWRLVNCKMSWKRRFFNPKLGWKKFTAQLIRVGNTSYPADNNHKSVLSQQQTLLWITPILIPAAILEHTK